MRIFDHVSSGPWLSARLKVRPTRSVCGRQPGDARDPRAQRLAWLPAPGTQAGKQGGLQTSSSSPHTLHSSSRRAPVSLPFRQTALASLLFGAWPGLSRWTLPVLRVSPAGWASPCFASSVTRCPLCPASHLRQHLCPLLPSLNLWFVPCAFFTHSVFIKCRESRNMPPSHTSPLATHRPPPTAATPAPDRPSNPPPLHGPGVWTAGREFSNQNLLGPPLNTSEQQPTLPASLP